jgi:hypothetical protein
MVCYSRLRSTGYIEPLGSKGYTGDPEWKAVTTHRQSGLTFQPCRRQLIFVSQ